jgi:hypothetical protein
MANGQTLYQAPQSNLQNLAVQYTQGMAQVNQIKGQVRAARAEELANLGAELDKISLTGLNDADKMFNESGVLLRQRISAAHQANARGEISRSEATRITNAAISEANMIVNSTEIIGKNYEDKKKRFEDGEISGAELDQFESGYFGMARNMNSNVKRWTHLTDGGNGLSFTHHYQYYDKDGILRLGKLERSLHDSVNPHSESIVGFNNDDWADTIQNVIGDRAKQDTNQVNVTNGQILQYARDHAADPQVRNTIEKLIEGYTDADLIGVLYDARGARARWSKSYTGEKGQSEVDALVIDQYFDKNGDYIKFGKGDLFTLDTDEKGNYLISDDQRELARAYLRQTAYTALDIDYRNVMNKDRAGGGDVDNEFLQPFNNIVIGKGESKNVTANVMASVNLEKLMSDTIGQKGIDEVTRSKYQNVINLGNQDMSYTNTLNTWNDVGEILEGGQPNVDWYNSDDIESNLYKNQSNNFSKVFLGGTGTDKTEFNLETMNGGQFETIDRIGYMMKEVDGESRVVILIGGSTETSEYRKQAGEQDVDDSMDVSMKRTNIVQTYGFAKSGQAQKIYDELYKSYPGFKEEADSQFKKGPGSINEDTNDKYAYALMRVLKELQ